MAVLNIEHIVKTPDVMGGKPRIAGTRIRVSDVALWHEDGASVEWMVEQFDLTPGQVYAALSYYHDHQQEIEQEIDYSQSRADGYKIMLRAVDSETLRAQIEARRQKQ